MNYDIADVVRMLVTFQTAAGAYVDPSTLQLRIKLPDGTTLDRAYPAQVTKTAVGQYYCDYQAAQSGVHYYRWDGTGTAQGASEGVFSVNVSAFA